jgi:hypothetical protein
MVACLDDQIPGVLHEHERVLGAVQGEVGLVHVAERLVVVRHLCTYRKKLLRPNQCLEILESLSFSIA